MQQVEIKLEDKVVLSRCKLANSFFSRFIGLMGKTQLDPEEGVIFPKCNSIHTFFMRMQIDVVFLDESGEVVKIFESLKPWRFLLPVSRAKHALEMAPERAKSQGIKVGARLSCPGVTV